MATAQEVVQQYLATKRVSGIRNVQDDMISQATRDIVEALPDGFTKKDVRACVLSFIDAIPELADVKAYRKTRTANLTIDDLVEKGGLAVNGDGQYHHVVSF